jgi:GNAT superfamily N-acetyltransferase
MKFLIDTNIFIPLEPTSETDLEAGSEAAVAFVRRAQESEHQVYVHPASRDDIARDKSDARRRLREVLFGKYPALPFPPTPTGEQEALIGHAAVGSNHAVDNALVVALAADAVDWLVSDDEGVHRKARRLGRGDRVLSLADARSLTEDLFAKDPPPPPAVRPTVAHDLRDQDPIFPSFREDYPGFDAWLTRCKREHRKTFVIDSDGLYGGVAILKDESPAEHGLSGKVLKLCSFKVSEAHAGRRYGELLLKPVFAFAEANGFDWIYVTVLPKHDRLVTLFEDFGFSALPGAPRARGELVMTKPMKVGAEGSVEELDALAFNRRYGPRLVRLDGVPAFVIPIQPHYHDLLFPEVQHQLSLQPGGFAAGNGLRKAYLCHSPTKTVPPGGNFFFYRSSDSRAVTVLGVVEGTMRSQDPVDVARYVGTRTVYSFTEIERLCAEGPVLAIGFRQARILAQPIPIGDLVGGHVLKGSPQSITRLSEEGAKWLAKKIEE